MRQLVVTIASFISTLALGQLSAPLPRSSAYSPPTETSSSSSGSSGVYPAWTPCLNGSWSIEFRTTTANGLLVYAEEETTKGAFLLKLVGGGARLRWLHESLVDVSLQAGQDLDDGLWHRAEVRMDGANSRLLFIIDKIVLSQPLAARVLAQLDHVRYSAVYVGRDVIASLQAAAGTPMVLSVLLEPVYVGEVARVLASECGARVTPSQPDFPSLSQLSPQSRSAPGTCGRQCFNGGVCVKAPPSEVCDCTATRYSGPSCEQGEFSCGLSQGY